MIARLRGILRSIESGQVLVEVNGITYSLLTSALVEEHLTEAGLVNREVEFHIFHYIEGGVALGNLVPRLVGFLNEEDLAFFNLLTTVQGLGVRKTLRALVMPTAAIALAIEMNDILTLKRLPEVGAKTAQKMVMELKGKALSFVESGEREAFPSRAEASLTEEYQRETVEILKQLQYSESEALVLVARTSAANPEITTADALVQEIFKRTKR